MLSVPRPQHAKQHRWLLPGVAGSDGSRLDTIYDFALLTTRAESMRNVKKSSSHPNQVRLWCLRVFLIAVIAYFSACVYVYILLCFVESL